MLDTLGSLIGSLTDIVGSISHIVIVAFRNIIFLAIIAAILWGLFRLGQRGFRHIRALRSDRAEGNEPNPKDKLENSPTDP